MKNIFIAGNLFLLLIPFLLQGNPDYYFQDVTEGHGLSNMGYVTICEDENGFVWFGGQNGLYYHNTLKIEKVELFNEILEVPTPLRINKIYKDEGNTIWICTNKGLVKYIRTTGHFEHRILNFPLDSGSAALDLQNIVQLNGKEYLLLKNQALYVFNEKENEIRLIANEFGSNVRYLNKDLNGNIYIGTWDGEIFEVRGDLQKFKLLYHNPGRPISSICKDGSKYYLGYHRIGVVVITSDGTKIAEFNSGQVGGNYIKNNFVSNIIRHPNGQVWIGTNEGIYILENNKLTLIDSKLESGLPHRRVFCLYLGLDDKVWVSSYAGSLACYSKFNYNFKHILLDYPQQQLDKSHVSTISEDSRGNVWIGSEDEGSIKVYSPTKQAFLDVVPEKVLKNIGNVKDIKNISDERVAFGQDNSDILTLFNYKYQTIEKRVELPIESFPGIRGVQCLNDVLWVHSPRQIVAYDLKAHRTLTTLNCAQRIWTLYFDSSHVLWVCTREGLYFLKPGSNTLELCHSKGNSEVTRSASIYNVCEDKDGLIWIGTTGHGAYVYNPENKTTNPAPDHQLSANADIYNLLRDNNNDIWYITNKGLFQYNSTLQTTNFYGTNNATLNAQNRLNACHLGNSGKLYYGAKSGFTIVDPSAIRRNPTIPKVFLSEFMVNNRRYTPDSSRIRYSIGLNHLKRVKLEADENTLLFKVVSNNYIKPERNRYRYRLLNYDNHWTNASHGKEIVFTKVPPGKYVFEAFGSNNDMVWSEEPYRLEIQIRHPLHLRWYSFLVYFVLLTAIAWWVFKEIQTNLKLRREIVETRNKSRVNELIHSERIKLFTNISHELRTPLSLIVSPISYILNGKSIDRETKSLLKTVERNAKQLQKTADQTIDFRLLETGKLEPNYRKHEIIQLLKGVFDCFEQKFIERDIKSSFSSDINSLDLLVDGDMIEKIVYNLISNAIKHTQSGVSISLTISEKEIDKAFYKNTIIQGEQFEGSALCIRVKDNGPGINSDLLPHLFKRFSKGQQANQFSTGIGLHLCSEYASMIHSNIQVISKESEGSCFSLNIPVKENLNVEKSEPIKLVRLPRKETGYCETLNTAGNPHAPTVLLVEDNGELRDFLKSLLNKLYKVITAKNGQQALEQLEHLMPDLIITDVAMPGLSGVELTKRLKQDPQYQHIPIIVITAYADRQYQMESILYGASAFFTKPIEQELLFAQIENSLKAAVPKSSNNKYTKGKTTSLGFIDKAEQVIVENLQNPDFKIADLLNQLNVSKTTLTRKLNAEVGLNASGFIREVRLKNAQKLLLGKNFNIDEIATFVGFNYTSYFVKSFKEKYGLTPSEFRKKAK